MNKFLDYTKQVFKGRTIYRILFNWQVYDFSSKIKGRVLDIAGDKKQSYYGYLPKNIEIVSTNIKKSEDKTFDFNEKFPFEDNSFDTVLIFNAIYIAKNPIHLLRESSRVLKDGGFVLLSSPFVSNEMPEPHDYRRYTKEGLIDLFKEAGFDDFEITSFGERFTSSFYLLHKFWFFDFCRFFTYGKALLFDKLIPKGLRENNPAPLGYFCVLCLKKNLK